MKEQFATRRESAFAARARVLLVEDEPDLQHVLRHNLQLEGFEIAGTIDIEQAVDLVREQLPDLVVLDVAGPETDGLEVCARLKADPETANVPIMMLTAKGEEEDIVAGLDRGADDYLTKPFSFRVLSARLRALLRRHNARRSPDAPIRLGDLVIRPGHHDVRISGEAIQLTATEFKLLVVLARQAGCVLTRRQIVEAIQPDMAAVTDRSVDRLIVFLRRKLKHRGEDLQTVRGVGYRFKE